jgi:hypothetical protein
MIDADTGSEKSPTYVKEKLFIRVESLSENL